MKLVIDDRTIEIPDSMVDEGLLMSYEQIITIYDSLDATLRMGMKMFVRNFLKELEKKHGTGIRPPKGADPTEHLLQLIYGFTAEALKRYASIEITTSGPEHSTAATLALAIENQGESWRQVVNRRDDGIGEDNLLEETAESLNAALPHEPGVHP